MVPPTPSKKEKEKLKDELSNSFFTTQSRVSSTLMKKLFKNTVGKGENAGNQHFLFPPQCFVLYETNLTMSTAKCFQFEPV